MPKVKINADGVGYSLPNPDPKAPPILAAAYRGEVVEMSAAEIDRLRKVRVRVFYTDPLTGTAAGAFREEPAVVDANEAETADADAVAAARQRVTELEDALAQARADLPLSDGPVPPPLTAVPAPTAGAARELPALGVPTLAATESVSTTPAPSSTPPAPPAPPVPPKASGSKKPDAGLR